MTDEEFIEEASDIVGEVAAEITWMIHPDGFDSLTGEIAQAIKERWKTLAKRAMILASES